MSTILRIKRSTTAGNPATLAAGELAYSAADPGSVPGGGRLYVGIGAESNGDAASHLVIGGQYFTDKLDHANGILTPNSALLVDSDSKLDHLKVDNLDFNGNTISSTDVNGNIVLSTNGSGLISASSTRIINVADPVNAQDVVTKAYLESNVNLEYIQDDIGAMIVGGTQSGLTVTYDDINDAINFSLDQDLSTTGNVTFNDVTVNGTLSSDDITAATMTASGNVVVQGDLTVNGTTTTVNSNTVDIGDSIILLNSDEAGTPSQNGGFEVERGTDVNVRFVWDEANDTFSPQIFNGVDWVNTTLSAQTFIGNFSGSIEGNSDTASAWLTARLLSLTGDATATLNNVDGTSDVSAVLTLADSGVTAGSYGSATEIPNFTVDSKGRLTAAGTNTIATSLGIAADGATSASVDLISDTLTFAGGTGLTSVAVAGTDTVTYNLNDTTVTGGSYGLADSVATFTVDGQGRLTAASDTLIDIVSTQVSDFDEAAQDAIGLSVAAGTQSNISVSYDDALNSLNYSVATATASTLGVAKFSTSNFLVVAGNVTLTEVDGGEFGA